MTDGFFGSSLILFDDFFDLFVCEASFYYLTAKICDSFTSGEDMYSVPCNTILPCFVKLLLVVGKQVLRRNYLNQTNQSTMSDLAANQAIRLDLAANQIGVGQKMQC